MRSITQAQRAAEFDKVRADYALKGPETGTRWADPMQANEIFELILRWMETGDPAFMDHALLFCFSNGLPIQPVLMRHLADAAMLRKTNGNADVPRPERETVKGRAFSIMANLMARGISKSRASEVAAVWTVDVARKSLKASTLEKEYNSTAWAKFADELMSVSDDAINAKWRDIEMSSRQITDDERGNRRQ